MYLYIFEPFNNGLPMKQTFLDIILKPAILVDLAIYIYIHYIYIHTHTINTYKALWKWTLPLELLVPLKSTVAFFHASLNSHQVKTIVQTSCLQDRKQQWVCVLVMGFVMLQ